MAEGLADLFGMDLWQPTGLDRSTSDLKYRFQCLVVGGQIDGHGNCNNILGLIPRDVLNTFEIEPRSQRGFKFVWKDTNGVLWEVHGHEQDAGAAAHYVGAVGWTCRIKCGDYYLMSEEWRSDFPETHANYLPPTAWKKGRGNWIIAHSHIPIINV